MKNFIQSVSLFLLVPLSLFSLDLGQAPTKQDLTKPGPFILEDKVCVVVENEPSILLSEIKKRAKRDSLSFDKAQQNLINERLLWVMAKTQMRYDEEAIKHAADEHIQQIMKSHGLSPSKLEETLIKEPYRTTIEQFQYERATDILIGQIRHSMESQVSVSKEEINKEAANEKRRRRDEFDLVFISIEPAKPVGRDPKASLSRQFKIANEIFSNLNAKTSLEQIKIIYGGKKHISIIGPLDYQKGAFEKVYEKKLEETKGYPATKPFRDDDNVTIIWKVKKLHLKAEDEGALIEKVRKRLYDREVTKKINAATRATAKKALVRVMDCGKLLKF